jgi:hypothetical protein
VQGASSRIFPRRGGGILLAGWSPTGGGTKGGPSALPPRPGAPVRKPQTRHSWAVAALRDISLKSSSHRCSLDRTVVAEPYGVPLLGQPRYAGSQRRQRRRSARASARSLRSSFSHGGSRAVAPFTAAQLSCAFLRASHPEGRSGRAFPCTIRSGDRPPSVRPAGRSATPRSIPSEGGGGRERQP